MKISLVRPYFFSGGKVGLRAFFNSHDIISLVGFHIWGTPWEFTESRDESDTAAGSTGESVVNDVILGCLLWWS